MLVDDIGTKAAATRDALIGSASDTADAELSSPAWASLATLGSDISRFGAATFVAVLLGALQVFVIPRRLAITTYGEYRVFLVYVTYLGAFHLGVVDGAFVRWAGRPVGIMAHEWRRVVRWVLGTHLVLVGIAVIGAQLAHPTTRTYIIALAVCALSVNTATFFSFALQAAGDFRDAGRVIVSAPVLFVSAVAFLPWHSLPVVLAEYVSSWAAAALVAVLYLARLTTTVQPVEPPPDDSIDYRSLVRIGLPVLGATIAAGLAQFGDRILVSFRVPVRTFALYGFASSVMVAASAAINALSRVSLSHAAKYEGTARAALLGGIYDVLGTGFGTVLLGFPLLEQLVGRLLPAYAAALPIARALIVGSLFWAAIHIVLVGTLQTYGLVRKQFVLELGGTALVGMACAIAFASHAPLWGVAAAASGAGAITWALGAAFVRRYVPDARTHRNLRFAAIGGAQAAAFGIACTMADAWVVRSVVYAALAFLPTFIAARAARAHWGRRPTTARRAIA